MRIRKCFSLKFGYCQLQNGIDRKKFFVECTHLK